ncbi:hypothetical protein [Ralstonia sp. NFACC01]|uniref:hypothetical protein n=1 Tax=Ralstonia sp. NFACC01 TaxID=1566294 RepID=UPI001113F2E2|nr:hypothetical protein [Ralstonia sp. NFACC01]
MDAVVRGKGEPSPGGACARTGHQALRDYLAGRGLGREFERTHQETLLVGRIKTNGQAVKLRGRSWMQSENGSLPRRPRCRPRDLKELVAHVKDMSGLTAGDDELLALISSEPAKADGGNLIVI